MWELMALAPDSEAAERAYGKRERFGDEPYRRRFRGSWAAGPLYYLGSQAVELLVRGCRSYGSVTHTSCR